LGIKNRVINFAYQVKRK